MSRELVLLTTDIAVISRGRILLIRRAKPPFEDRLVLPGGHVESGETALQAAIRELGEETGIWARPEELCFLTYLDRPDRDPRPSRRVSFVFCLELDGDDPRLASCMAADDAREIVWRELASLVPKEIGFDHLEAIRLLS